MRSQTGLVASIVLVAGTLASPAPAQPLEDLPGYERYLEVQRSARSLATGGTVRRTKWTDDALFFSADGQRYRFDLAAGTLAEFDGEEPESEADDGRGRRRPPRGRQRTTEPSPDGRWKAECRDYNVILVDADTGAEEPLTTDGHRKHRFGQASWVYGEELRQRSAMWWSPDSSMLAWYEFDERQVPDYVLLHGLTELRPETVAEGYPKPGDPNPVAALHVQDLESRRTTRIDTGDPDGVGHYVYNIRFSPDGKLLLFNRTNRHQNDLEIVAADPADGTTRVVVRETQPTWQSNLPVMRFLEDGHRFIWESEASGYRHFELRDLDGTHHATLTSGDFPCGSIVRVDEADGLLYFTAYGGGHPLNRHLYRVGLDGRGQRRLTREPLSHTVSMSPDAQWFITRYEAVDTAPTTALYRVDGTRVATLAESDTSRFRELELTAGELFSAPAADGQTTLYGVLYKPSDFDPDRVYPLVVQVYGGPFSQQVQNRYAPVDALCELGVLVARLDNRGTPGRGKAFEAATYRKLGTVDLDDQVAGVRALAERPYVDGDRVGIYGHSYGGFMSALAVLKHPDVFRVGVAGSAVTDWRNYDTIYTERIMMTPEENSDGYEQGACMTFADQLEGGLLILHGLMDDNVHPTNAWQLVAALQDEGKRFETMFFPQRGHALGRGARARRIEFLHRYLIGAEAPAPKPASPRAPPADARPRDARDPASTSRPPS